MGVVAAARPDADATDAGRDVDSGPLRANVSACGLTGSGGAKLWLRRCGASTGDARADEVLGFRRDPAREMTCDGGREPLPGTVPDSLDRAPPDEGTPDTRLESAGEGGAGRDELGEPVTDSGRARPLALALLKVLKAGLLGLLATPLRPASRLLGMLMRARGGSSSMLNL